MTLQMILSIVDNLVTFTVTIILKEIFFLLCCRKRYIVSIYVVIWYTANRIYFTDAGTDQISSMQLDGSNRQVIHSDPNTHFFAIAVYNQYLYYTDWTTQWVTRDSCNDSFFDI